MAKERVQADHQSQVRADANESDKQLLREMQAARTEGLRSLREQKLHTAQQEKLLLEKEREQAFQASQVKRDRDAAESAQKHELALVEAEGYRYKKEQRKLDAAQARLRMAKERVQADQQSQVRVDTASAERATKHAFAVAHADGLKAAKAQRAAAAERETRRLVKARRDAEAARLAKADADAAEKQLKHDAAVAQAEGYKYRKAEQLVIDAQVGPG
jgi:hypothetical protein